jgi:hypothetical protein
MADSPPDVFISWSLPRSRAVAAALRKWLPVVVQRSTPWMSETDIYTGQRWRKEIANNLATAKVGIICTTPENWERPWLNFEAGAISKQVGGTERVCCFCFDMVPVDLKDPLADFNGVEANSEGAWNLVRSINQSLDGQRIDEGDLKTSFDALWPKLETALSAIQVPAGGSPSAKRKPEDIAEETLVRLRRLESFVLQAMQPGARGTMAAMFDPEYQRLVEAAQAMNEGYFRAAAGKEAQPRFGNLAAAFAKVPGAKPEQNED